MATPSKPRLYTPTFALVQISALAYFVAYGMTLPILPRFVRGPLSGSNVAVGLVAAGFSITAVFVRPFAGRLGDRRGRRPLVVGGAIIVAGTTVANAGILAFRDATSHHAAVVALLGLRLLLGIGEGMFFTGAATVVNDLAPEERRGEAVSLFTLSLYGGLALGPVFGELIYGHLGFTAVWIASAAMCAFASLLGLAVPDTRPEQPPGPPERHRLVHPAALAPGIVLATSTWAFAGFNTFLPLYALSIHMHGSGTVYLVYASLIAAVRLFGARIPDRFGAKATAGVSLAGSVAGLALIAALRSQLWLYGGAIVFAAGQSLAFPALLTMAVRGAPASERGSVVGTFTSFVDVGFGLGPLTLGAVAGAFGYAGVFAGGAVSAAAGLAILLVRRTHAPVSSNA